MTLDYITLADTMAWATPLAIKRVVGSLRERWPDLDIALHLHDTRGMAIANAYAGLEMGVTRFDAAVAGLGGCPFAGHAGAAGNVCTEDLVFMCNELGIATGIDLDALIECAKLAEDVVGHPLPGSVMKGGTLAEVSGVALVPYPSPQNLPDAARRGDDLRADLELRFDEQERPGFAHHIAMRLDEVADLHAADELHVELDGGVRLFAGLAPAGHAHGLIGERHQAGRHARCRDGCGACRR